MFTKTMLHTFISLFLIALTACAALPTSGAAVSPARSQGGKSPVTVEASTASSPTAASQSETSPASTLAAQPVPAEAPAAATQAGDLTYPIVDTGQTACYDAGGAIAACPTQGSALFGQDAQYTGNPPRYTNNDDPSTGSRQAGTITDNVTGLMWQKSPDTNGDGAITAADKLTYDAAVARAETLTLGGYTDWRLPTIKELYSLILFDGIDPSGLESSAAVNLIPFIDNTYFDFAYGDTGAGERIIDAQYASSTKYVSTTMNGAETMFGVNFADGRIKGYPTGPMPGQSEGKGFFVLYVRGNPDYGVNDLTDNSDDTITDNATGLMWAQNDSGTGLKWADALAYCENLTAAGYDDWRLPSVKELQSIVDYTRSPDTTGSAAIDPLFNVTPITNEAGQIDYPAYWSSTTHANFANGMGAAYVNFGRSLGYMNNAWIDVHGAGAQRSDPKAGDPANYPTGHGPQGDAIRIYNYARCVRDGGVIPALTGDSTSTRAGRTIESTGSDQSTQPSGASGQQNGQSGPPGDQQQPGGMPGQQNGPSDQLPQEAIDACSGQSQGAACQFTNPQGRITGTCNQVQQQMGCVPQGGAPGGRPTGNPPPSR